MIANINSLMRTKNGFDEAENEPSKGWDWHPQSLQTSQEPTHQLVACTRVYHAPPPTSRCMTTATSEIDAVPQIPENQQRLGHFAPPPLPQISLSLPLFGNHNI